MCMDFTLRYKPIMKKILALLVILGTTTCHVMAQEISPDCKCQPISGYLKSIE